MTDNFARRLAAIPPEYLKFAKGTCWPNATMEEIVSCAERLIAYKEGKIEKNLDCFWFSPFISRRATKIIFQALMEFDTCFEEDVPCLMKLRNEFKDYFEESLK